MSLSTWLVGLGGIAAIVWVNWYFFIAGKKPVAAAATARSRDGVQEQVITVDGGYSPAVVRVAAGRPVRLVFDRRDTGSCSEEVVLPDFGIRKFLPSGQRTPVDLTPEKAGQFEITCGMSMLHGRLVVEG